jgi:hypothetical protein
MDGSVLSATAADAGLTQPFPSLTHLQQLEAGKHSHHS